MVYIREAHAPGTEDEGSAAGVHFAREDAAETLTERRKQAQFLADGFHVSVPILIDDAHDSAAAAYHAQPDRLYVIDADGRIAHAGRPGPQGLRIVEVPRVLDKLLDVSYADQLEALNEEQWGPGVPYTVPPAGH